MLTKTDFKKLKELFATKEDFRQFATKDDLHNAVEDLIEYTNAVSKTDKKEIIDTIKQLAKEVSSVLNNHEGRIHKLESDASLN